MQKNNFYGVDVIVIGGGHAGVEAALASARVGANTMLITHSIDTIGQMSCNPAIGGIGKGHLVKEIDALGGVMAKAADLGGIQFRTLNQSKGPAVRATRAQADRNLYRVAIRNFVENQPNLRLFQQGVDDLIIEGDVVKGVVTQTGLKFFAKKIVLTTGTFLGGVIHIGDKTFGGGRAGDAAASVLAQKLRQRPFRVGRLKTGTPPRIDKTSVDFKVLIEQPGDDPRPVFSFTGTTEDHPAQVSCFIAQTNTRTHAIIRDNIKLSAMYSGNIEGVGPRYCPSIEDKIMRFSDKSSHQIFVEPEGLNACELYPNGISTSLPFDVQLEFVRSMQGFENAVITRPGYAIEYDYFDPRDLKGTMETRFIEGLYFAGQINGTTGYEEAAAQGLIAGLNAARTVLGKSSWYPKRSEAYIGVLIDDLITCGTTEPYRMFTSRAEYRLSLREDNADERLTKIGHELGLVDNKTYELFVDKISKIESTLQVFKTSFIQPDTNDAKRINKKINKPLEREYSLLDLLKRPELNIEFLKTLDAVNVESLSAQSANQLEIKAKYSGYLARQELEIERHARNENTKIPKGFDYAGISGLSSEIIEKLSLQQPETVGLASRVPGVTPAAVSLILVYLKKHKADLHVNSEA